MRFVSYNIHRGVGTDGTRSIARIANVIGGLAPDVVGVNEVVRTSVTADQPARLARALGMSSAFQANVRRRNSAYGNLVLARGKILSRRDLKLPGGAEKRGLLLAGVEVDGEEFVFGVTHLSPERNARAEQIKAIAAALPRDRPLVLAGDFNASPAELEQHRSAHLGWLALAEPQLTFPTPVPDAAIDRILFSEHWRLTHVSARPDSASDHAALCVELASVY